MYPFTNKKKKFTNIRDFQLDVLVCECNLLKMSSIEEKLSEAVRKYPVLYDKGSQDFKDRRKKKLAWDDVAEETGLKRK